MYEVFVSIEGKKKTYLVFDLRKNYGESVKASKKYFRVSEKHIMHTVCWILNDELYFKNPNTKGSKMKIAFFWCK